MIQQEMVPMEGVLSADNPAVHIWACYTDAQQIQTLWEALHPNVQTHACLLLFL